MGRRNKVGLEYFPVDTFFQHNMRLIEAEFGMKGLGVIVKLWQRIYGEQGYYVELDEEAELLFANEANVGGSLVSEIVRAAIKRGIFHQGLYDKYKILTSHGIQTRYLTGASRRTRVEMEQRYLLLSAHEIPKYVYINKENVYRNEKKACRNQQSKVKESKVKESKGESVEKHAHGKYKNVFLTDEELEDLKKRYPADYQKKIERLSVGMEIKGYRYLNHYATILAWAEEDAEKEKQGRAPKGSRFNNYQDTNGTNYDALEEGLVAAMYEEGIEDEDTGS